MGLNVTFRPGKTQTTGTTVMSALVAQKSARFCSMIKTKFLFGNSEGLWYFVFWTRASYLSGGRLIRLRT